MRTRILNSSIGQVSVHVLIIVFDPSVLTCVLGAQKNRLIETVLLSTTNICFPPEIRKNKFHQRPDYNYKHLIILISDIFIFLTTKGCVGVIKTTNSKHV